MYTDAKYLNVGDLQFILKNLNLELGDLQPSVLIHVIIIVAW
jgi:hypothetical protein